MNEIYHSNVLKVGNSMLYPLTIFFLMLLIEYRCQKNPPLSNKRWLIISTTTVKFDTLLVHNCHCCPPMPATTHQCNSWVGANIYRLSPTSLLYCVISWSWHARHKLYKCNENAIYELSVISCRGHAGSLFLGWSETINWILGALFCFIFFHSS